MKKDRKLLVTGIITAIGASLCCITPVLALISGASGMASSFTWLEPFRPYLIVTTVGVLGFAWFQKLRPAKEVDCDCEVDEKTPFIQSKTFLGLVTAFAILALTFPSYSSIFYANNEKEIVIVDNANIQSVNFKIEGMTCTSCQVHVNHSVNELEGILTVNSSYEHANSEITFDQSKTSREEIENAINSTGYIVINE